LDFGTTFGIITSGIKPDFDSTALETRSGQ